LKLLSYWMLVLMFIDIVIGIMLLYDIHSSCWWWLYTVYCELLDNWWLTIVVHWPVRWYCWRNCYCYLTVVAGIGMHCQYYALLWLLLFIVENDCSVLLLLWWWYFIRYYAVLLMVLLTLSSVILWYWWRPCYYGIIGIDICSDRYCYDVDDLIDYGVLVLCWWPEGVVSILMLILTCDTVWFDVEWSDDDTSSWWGCYSGVVGAEVVTILLMIPGVVLLLWLYCDVPLLPVFIGRRMTIIIDDDYDITMVLMLPIIIDDDWWWLWSVILPVPLMMTVWLLIIWYLWWLMTLYSTLLLLLLLLPFDYGDCWCDDIDVLLLFVLPIRWLDSDWCVDDDDLLWWWWKTCWYSWWLFDDDVLLLYWLMYW